MIIADTSGLLASFNRAEPTPEAVAAVVAGLGTPPIVPPYVLAELDHLVLPTCPPAHLTAGGAARQIAWAAMRS